MAYGCEVEHIRLPIEAVDTHRPKPPSPTLKSLGLDKDAVEILTNKTESQLQLGSDDKVIILWL